MRRRRFVRGAGIVSGVATPLSAVVFGTSATLHSSETGFVSNFSTAFDSGATGADRLLLAAVVYENGGDPDVTGMTYNGVAMTKVVEATVAPADAFSESVEVWALAAPATGSNTLAMTNSATSQDAALMVAVYENVNQSTPTGATATEARLLSDDGTVELDIPHRGGGFWAVVQDRGGASSFAATEGGNVRQETVIGSASAGFVAALGDHLDGGDTAVVGAMQVGATTAESEQDIVVVAVVIVAAT